MLRWSQRSRDGPNDNALPVDETYLCCEGKAHTLANAVAEAVLKLQIIEVSLDAVSRVRDKGRQIDKAFVAQCDD